MSLDAAWYINADGSIRVNELLVSFQQFFQEHSESWTEIAQYKEAPPSCFFRHFCSGY